MTLVQFFLKYLNRKLDFDGIYPGECVDVIKAYMVEVLGMLPVKGNAIDYWTDIPGFKKIKKGLFNYPKPGDIIIWNKKISPYGHIAIVNWVRTFDVGCFEQNFPVGSPCHYQTHNYKNVIGWLEPQLVSIPKIPLELAYLGQNFLDMNFFYKVKDYSSNKITFQSKNYNGTYAPAEGMITQDEAYAIVDQVNPSEKFVFIFYTPNATSSLYASYYYPKKDCVITTCPGQDPKLLAFELSHQLQMYFNAHRGSEPPVQIEDQNFPNDNLIRQKYDSVSHFYQ